MSAPERPAWAHRAVGIGLSATLLVALACGGVGTPGDVIAWRQLGYTEDFDRRVYEEFGDHDQPRLRVSERWLSRRGVEVHVIYGKMWGSLSDPEIAQILQAAAKEHEAKGMAPGLICDSLARDRKLVTVCGPDAGDVQELLVALLEATWSP